MYRLIFLLGMLLCTATLAISQNNEFTLIGSIQDNASKQPIEYATVVLQNKTTGAMLSGATTESGGVFKLSADIKDVQLEISFIGYDSKTITDITFINQIADLGIIYLGGDTKLLDEVIVTAEKSTTEFKLDKRVFNVGTDLSTTGASALEVLNNVPSVNVSIEGDITLRGTSGAQILINGKPSVLADENGGALGSITADMIDKVEVITNPSAKYEAEGSAGIINIVLKKDEKKGLNGSITANTGLPHNHSFGLSMNRRTEKFNLFTQLGVGYRSLPSDIITMNRDLQTNEEINSTGEEFRNENFYNIILGSDYYINKTNVITLSGSFTYEVEDQPSTTEFERLINGETVQEWSRSEVTSATNPKLQYELQYKKDFEDDEDHQLLFSAIGNYFGKDQSSIFENNFTAGRSLFENQMTATNFDEGKFTFNLDYTKPLNEKVTIETGAQYLLNDVSNDFSVSNEENGVFVIDEGLTNVFNYDQKVLGVYGTAAYEGEFWGLKVGLRAENTDLSTLLVNTNEVNEQSFANLFPSLHTSYKLTERISVQAGYSRRIYRPRLWDLNPFFNIRNNFSVRAGNPNLLPEFTDSYEAGAIFIWDQLTFNTNVYHRFTTDKIERVSVFDNNVNVFLPENIGTNSAVGIEANFKYSPVKRLTLNGDANFNIFDRKGSFNDQNFDFSASQWNGKLTGKLKANKNLDLEVTAQHESRQITIQGEQRGNTWANLGARYKILNGKGIFSLSVRDLFASRIRQTTVDQETFFTFRSGQRGRFITFGFSYGFGKGEAIQYSGGRRR